MYLFLRSTSAWVLLCSVAVSCGRRHGVSANCQWPAETLRPLALHRAAERAHLRNDVDYAEDIAILHADSLVGIRSQHYQGPAEYDRTRERCLDTLFASLAAIHTLSPNEVRGLRGSRPLAFDLGVILSFFALYYGVLGFRIAGSLIRSVPPEHLWPPLLATLVVSLPVSFIGVLAGDFWSFTAEGLRLSNGHLSYRAARIPWSRHALALFVIGVLVFCIVSLLRYRFATSRNRRGP